MSVVQSRTQGGPFRGNSRHFYSRNINNASLAASFDAYNHSNDNQSNGFNHSSSYYDKPYQFSNKVCREYYPSLNSYVQPDIAPPLKKRKFSASSWENSWRHYHHPNTYVNVPPAFPVAYDIAPCHHLPQKNHKTYDSALSRSNSTLAAPDATRLESNIHTSTLSKRNRSMFEEEDDVSFLSRDEIEKSSPSRKDGIDAMHEMQLRYSYCAFLQNVGLRLDLPQTTIGTAMVLCHRFFLRRSHASHDRFLIATAALFLCAKSEETPRPLNNVLKVSCEIFHKQDLTLLSHALPLDWFEQYRERVLEAEQLILTTLNFELGVQHPYEPLISTLEKLGFSQSVLVHLALNLVSEGIYRGISMLACIIFLAGG